MRPTLVAHLCDEVFLPKESSRRVAHSNVAHLTMLEWGFWRRIEGCTGLSQIRGERSCAPTRAAYTAPQIQIPYSAETTQPPSAAARPAPTARATDNPAPADRNNPRPDTGIAGKSKSCPKTSRPDIRSYTARRPAHQP